MRRILLYIMMVTFITSFAADFSLKHEPAITPGHTMYITTICKDGTVKKETRTSPQSEEMKARKSKALEGSDLFPLRVKALPNATGDINIAGVYVMLDEYVNWDSQYEEVSEFMVPQGTYTIQVVFDTKPWINIFLTDVKVDGETNLEVSSDMYPTKTVYPGFLLPNGEQAVMPTYDDERNKTDKPYNIESSTGDYRASYKNLSMCSMYYYVEIDGAEYYKHCGLSTNLDDSNGELSWVIEYDSKYDSPDPAMYFNTYVRKADTVQDGEVLLNDIANFQLWQQEFAMSPASKENGADVIRLEANYRVIDKNGKLISELGKQSSADTKVYTCDPMVNPLSATDWFALVLLGSIDYFDDERWIEAGVKSPYAAMTEDGKEFYSITQYADGPRFTTFKFNPYFSFPAGDKVLGNSSAYTNVGTQDIDWTDKPFKYYYPNLSYGLYGELRMVDFYLTKAMITYNGQPVDVSSYPSLFTFEEAWASNDHAPGVMSYTFYNDNISVDGVTGSNVIVATIDETKEDKNLPILKSLLFRDVNDDVTFRFSKCEDGVITIAGGDFESHQETVYGGCRDWTFTWETPQPTSIKVEYAPYALNDFEEIDMKENPKKMVPGYGYFWEGSLARVDRKSENGWFDLRVTLTDEAGNSQSQVISPAFHVDNMTGVAAPSMAKAQLSVMGHKIVASDGAEVEVYTLSGMRVANRDIAPGVYIARSGAASAKMSVR